VQQKFRQVEESDYFTLLELPASASTADVQQAHRALRAEFTPAALPYRCRSGLDRELRQIARALDEARAILGEDSARRVYLQKLGGAATSG
jgi:DnaJ-class molecular chaperone